MRACHALRPCAARCDIPPLKDLNPLYPESGHVQRNYRCPLSANIGHCAAYSITSIRPSSCGGIPQFGARIGRLIRQHGDRCTRLTSVHAANKACGQSGQVSNLAQFLYSNFGKQDGSKHQSPVLSVSTLKIFADRASSGRPEQASGERVPTCVFNMRRSNRSRC